MPRKGDHSPLMPAPPAPQRREALPWQTPKALEDDPQAMARVQAILTSPGYRQAGQDVAFLNQDETRGVRLQIDYLKPERVDQGYPDYMLSACCGETA